MLKFRDPKEINEEALFRNQTLESVGLLAGKIAHDFNNSLTAILGNISLAQLSLRQGEVSSIKIRLDDAEKAVLDAVDISERFLTFSKGGAPVKKLVSIKELVEKSVRNALKNSLIKYQSVISHELWPVEIDEKQISQVIQNLVSNAREAMSNSGTIIIQVENIQAITKGNRGDQKAHYLKITVKDSGVGIAQEDLSKLFLPFFTTKRMRSGLGLATAYSIVKRHNGMITVHSAPGRGSTFSVFLPASPFIPISKYKRGKEVSKGKGSVLVMDDEESVREMAKAMLIYAGYDVDCATEGFETIKLYRNSLSKDKSYDVVILDLTTRRGLGGKETMTRLLEINPQIKAIVSSGYSDDSVLAEYKKYKFKGLVHKPYRLEELEKVLNEVIKRE